MSGTKGHSGPRPRSPEGNRIYKTLRLAPETDRIIRAEQRAGEKYAQVIDRWALERESRPSLSR